MSLGVPAARLSGGEKWKKSIIETTSYECAYRAAWLVGIMFCDHGNSRYCVSGFGVCFGA
jgi:hypothetical protein